MAGIKGAVKALAKALGLREGSARKSNGWQARENRVRDWIVRHRELGHPGINLAPLLRARTMPAAAGVRALDTFQTNVVALMQVDTMRDEVPYKVWHANPKSGDWTAMRAEFATDQEWAADKVVALRKAFTDWGLGTPRSEDDGVYEEVEIEDVGDGVTDTYRPQRT